MIKPVFDSAADFESKSQFRFFAFSLQLQDEK
jgi:hypothetical protein